MTCMKRMATGGDGETRAGSSAQREIVRAGGFAGFDELSWEEDIESNRFRRRVASGEIRLVRSRTFPEF